MVKEWFYENFMILNPDKCHYTCIGKNTESDIFKFENVFLENSKEEVILGITINSYSKWFSGQFGQMFECSFKN